MLAYLGGIVTGIAASFFAIVAAASLYVFTGAYDARSTEAHPPFVGWVLDATVENSVLHQADAVKTPYWFSPQMVASGARTYSAACLGCHGAPGIEPVGWAAEMQPRPGRFSATGSPWSPREIFWIAKHGIKMSGMPAFGGTYDDQTLWNVAAFVDQVRAMTAEEFAGLTRTEPEAGPGPQVAASR